MGTYEEQTQVRFRKTTLDYLKGKGKKDESYNDIVDRLLGINK